MRRREETFEEWDKHYMRDHYNEGYFVLEAHDGDLCIHTTHGSRMGNVWAPYLFATDYNRVVAQWNGMLGGNYSEDRALLAADPLTSRVVNLALTAYVDDLARAYVAPGPHALANKAQHSSDLLDGLMLTAGYAQNLDNMVGIPSFRGPGSAAATRALTALLLCFEGRCIEQHGILALSCTTSARCIARSRCG